MQRWCCLVLALAAGCGDDSASFPSVGGDDGIAMTDRIGIAAGMPWGADGAADRAARIARIESLGIRRLRTDFYWHRLETAKGQWDFSGLDPVVTDCYAAGIQLLAIAAYGNPIYPSASGGTGPTIDGDPRDFYPPTDPSYYAKYVGMVVGRYGAQVTDWELWNEENIGYRFWRPQPDAAFYASYVAAAVAAGRGVCPHCRFILGGVSMPQPIPQLDLYPIGPKFLGQVAATGTVTSIDAVAFHPYQYPKDPPEFETAPFPTRKQGSLATQARLCGDAAAPLSPTLWITENGWPTNPGIPQTDDQIAQVFGIDPTLAAAGRELLGPTDWAKLLETIRGVPEDAQARYTVRGILGAAALRIPRVYLYTLDDFTNQPDINQEAAFGLFRADGSEKPAAGAVRTMLTRLGGYRFAGDVAGAMDLADPDRALAFRDGSKLLLAMWRWKDGTHRFTVTDLPGATQVLDLSGHTLASAGRDGEVTVTLGPDPIWVEVIPGP